METKDCAHAEHQGNRTLPLSEFYRRKESPDGLHSWCKTCCKAYNRARSPRARRVASHRRSHLKLVYDLTPEQYKEMLAKQEGVCAICQRPPGSKALMVDHDHATGEPRGLLCRKCNTGLGFFNDNVQTLMRAADYLIAR